MSVTTIAPYRVYYVIHVGKAQSHLQAIINVFGKIKVTTDIPKL